MAKDRNRIGPCSPTLDGAPSAPPISLCLNSLRPLAASTAERPLARRATRLVTPPSMCPSLVVPAALRSIRPAQRRAGSVASPRHTPTSASPARRRTPAMLSTGATVRTAARPKPVNGSLTTRSERMKIDVAGISRTRTGFPWPSTTPCYGSRAACAPCAERKSPTRTGGQERSSGLRLTTAIRLARYAACSARNATGQSVCSTTTRFSCVRRSATCCGLARIRFPKRGGDCCPSFAKEGSSY